MHREEVFEKIIEVCKEIFDDDTLVLTEQSSAKDVEEWDSLTHLNIISDIEDEFDINFSLNEISDAKNIGDLVTFVMKHMEG